MTDEKFRSENNPLKVLLIGDNSADARLVREMFAEAKGVGFKTARQSLKA